MLISRPSAPSPTLNHSAASETLDPFRLPDWFAIFTYPRHEKKVTQQLNAISVETFLPTYNVKKLWKNRQTVSLAVPLFPSYVFARLRRSDRGDALALPGIVSIVGQLDKASAVADRYIELLRTGLALGRILPQTDPVIGDRVRIVSGPFGGTEGTLAFIRSQFRVVVSIEMIRQSVSIEVMRDEIEPVAPFRLSRRDS